MEIYRGVPCKGVQVSLNDSLLLSRSLHQIRVFSLLRSEYQFSKTFTCIPPFPSNPYDRSPLPPRITEACKLSTAVVPPSPRKSTHIYLIRSIYLSKFRAIDAWCREEGFFSSCLPSLSLSLSAISDDEGFCPLDREEPSFELCKERDGRKKPHLSFLPSFLPHSIEICMHLVITQERGKSVSFPSASLPHPNWKTSSPPAPLPSSPLDCFFWSPISLGWTVGGTNASSFSSSLLSTFSLFSPWPR